MHYLSDTSTQYDRDILAFTQAVLPTHIFSTENTSGSIEVDESAGTVELVALDCTLDQVRPGQYAALMRSSLPNRLLLITHVSSPDAGVVIVHGILPEARD